MSSNELTLDFIENDSVIGQVVYREGSLYGNEACIAVVRNRMQRNGLNPGDAVKSMDGWSNGYLTTRLLDAV